MASTSPNFYHSQNGNLGTAYEYSTFSGADIVCSITVPLLVNDPKNQQAIHVSQPITIANLQTVSISTYTDKWPVRTLGKRGPRGFTRGARSLSGTLVFTMFDRESLAEVNLKVRDFYQQTHNTYSSAYGNATLRDIIPLLPPDELPPFDITITMVNDNGQSSLAKILGVEIVTTGQVMGIDDLFIEETMQYQAREFYPMIPVRPFVVSSQQQKLIA
jgi:hypothetical protein